MNVQDATIQILKDAGKPLHAKEIAERIMEAGLWSSDGKTPEATVSARLYSDIKKHGGQSTFVKVAPQTFFLRDTQVVAICDAKEPEPRNANLSDNSKKTYSFLDAAEKVLDQFGNRNAMHYRDITDKAMNQGWLNTSGKTTEATMNAQLVTELKRAKASGEPGRFVQTSPGYYSLVKWMGTGLPYQISKHNREIRKKLLSQLMDLSPGQILMFDDFLTQKNVPFPTPVNHKFTFIDLFAGIGGMRIAFQNLGGKCVFSSEIDEQAQKTYSINFGELPAGDITKIDEKEIPNHDVLVGGFPCQAFSIAGKRGGFNDTRGTLFFDVARIIKEKQPKAFFLENVKGLVNHRSGKTLATILNVLREDLGYIVPEPKVMNAKNFGVPQNRERIFIVGFRSNMGVNAEDFTYPEATDTTKCIEDIMEKDVVSAKFYLSTKYLECLEKHKARNEAKGNGFGYEIKDIKGVSNTIVTGGMGRERNLIIDKRLKDFTPVTNIQGEVNRKGIRKMTPREWARLQGFPDEFRIEVADVQAYKQFGNSVAIPAIQATAEKLLEKLIKD